MIKILCVGKIKESYLEELIQDYLKRIKKYHDIKIIEVKDENSLEKERDSLMKYISRKEYLITLEIDGNSLSSEELAKKIDQTFIAYPCITFIIGSSLGLHDDIKRCSHFSFSFSHLTFPHGLFRGLLLEQIYRSFKILNHETYHK